MSSRHPRQAARGVGDRTKHHLASEFVGGLLDEETAASGVVEGVDAVVERAQAIAADGVSIDLQYVLDGLENVAVALHNTGRRGGATLDEHLTTAVSAVMEASTNDRADRERRCATIFNVARPGSSAGTGRSDPPPAGASLEIVCPSEDSARDEAERRNRDSTDSEIEWIYLHNSANQWVARRVERYPELNETKRPRVWWDILGEALQHAFNLYH